MSDRRFDELSKAFSSLAENASPRADCPETDAIRAAAHGEVDASQVGVVLDHMVTCAACVELWQVASKVSELAREQVVPGVEPQRSPAKPSEPGLWHWLTGALSGIFPGLAGAGSEPQVATSAGQVSSASWALNRWAMALLLGTGLVLVALQLQWSQRVAHRGLESVLASKTAESLPRDAFLLQWTEFEGASYSVDVFTEQLEPIFEAHGLTLAEVQVPTAELSGLAVGTEILWQVEVFSPDGGQTTEPETFVTRLE